MKERRKGLLWEMALILLTVAACLYSTGAGNIFGAKVDWSSQHSVFPEYFRQQFYRTGQFFPEFALNIGGGQNIYNFSYYGLFSPVVLIGYLLPNVKMSDYMMVASIVCLAAAVIILYRWLKSREFTAAVSGMTALMFLFAGPMIYQSSHQIMFVNYMPFLCLTFLGIDRYFEQKKSGLLIGGTFLMIMTSFYFSIGGILALGLYGIYRYARTKERAEEMVTVKGFLGDGLRFARRILTAIMLAGVLLVPTAMALLGRSGSKGEKTDIWQLLTPQINLEKFLYGAYGPGLSCLMLIILLTGLFYKKAYEKILSLGCLVVLTVPFFSYLLNGALYIRPKSLIPFLPLLCYLTAKYLEKLKNQKIARIWMLLPCLAIIIYIYLKKDDVKSEVLWKLLLLDAVITLLICVAQAYSAWIRKYLTVAVLGPVILSLIVTGSYSWEKSGNLESRKAYEEDTSRSIGKAVDKAITSDSGFYRVEQVGNEDENAENLNRVWNSEQYITSLYSSSYNADYQNFRKNDFQVEQPYRNFLMQSVSQNPVFRQLMGVKYLISSQNIPGYEKKWMTGGGDVYCNENAAPIAYETDQTMSEAEYDRLDFPYNQLVFTRYAVTKDGTVSAGQVKEKLAEDKLELQSRLKEIRASLSKETEALENIVSNVEECTQAVEDGKNEIIEILNSRATTKGKVQRFDAMLEQLNIRKAEISQRILRLKSEEEVLEKERLNAQKQYDAVTAVIHSTNEECVRLDGEVQKLQDELKKQNSQMEIGQTAYHREASRLESLKNITERYDGYGNSIRRVMEQKNREPGIKGVVADIIHVQKDYEVAIETALGGSIQNIVTVCVWLRLKESL